jgi:hypothetical protein
MSSERRLSLIEDGESLVSEERSQAAIKAMLRRIDCDLMQRMRAVDVFAMPALPPHLVDISRDQSYRSAKLLDRELAARNAFVADILGDRNHFGLGEE